MPCTSGELWGHHLMPQTIDLDILLPTGVVVPLKCTRDQTLFQIKDQLWREGPNFPYFHLIHKNIAYVFVSVTSDAKKEEFHDETRRLCDLHLFISFLKLVEPNASTKQENILSSQITAALGFKVSKLDEIEAFEVVEFRREAVNVCREVVDSRESTLDVHANYAYSAQICTTKVTSKLWHGESVMLRVWVDLNRTVMVKVPCEANADTVIRETLECSSKKSGVHEIIRNCQDYVLKICGREEYLLGTCAISKYKYIQDCHRKNQLPPVLEFVEKRKLYNKLPKQPFHIPAYYRRPYRVSENDAIGAPLTHLWRLNIPLRVQVLWATFINATDNFLTVEEGMTYDVRILNIVYQFFADLILFDCMLSRDAANIHSFERKFAQKLHKFKGGLANGRMQVCVKAGIFHGDEQLCGLQQTSQKPMSNGPRWNEHLTFDISVADIPRSARLCISLCSVSKNKKKQEEYLMIVWGNVNLFDFKGRLITGKFRLELWPSPLSMDSMSVMNPLGITGSRLEKEGSVLELEFDRYSSAVFYPEMKDMYSLKGYVINDEPGNSDPQRDVDYIESLVRRDPLCEVSEQDKHLVWQYREYCKAHFPESLPRLVASVKWSSREQTAVFYELLKDWQNVSMETALALLDCKCADIFVREFAVKNLDQILLDSDVLDLLLQLVQSLKYEPYINSPCAVFLLRRALKNRLIGHYFFWHLRSEISGNSWFNVRFGLILEAYCRGLCGHLKFLNKQVEALEKLTMLTDTLKEKRDETPKDRLRFLVEQIKQPDFLEVLENIKSPVNPCIELGSLKVESCRIMDSAKRPLWLVWHNNDPLAKQVGIGETAAIFKNGDDLRQDTLTLQVVRMMDELWRRDGLDLKMLTYTCLATGKQAGLIQVVPNAQTVYTIQRKAGTLAAIQVNSRQLYKWLLEKNRDPDKCKRAIETFTNSCAGYCVATFVLGIGDRNPDNIMVAEDGHIFHIDFGHFLGHFKKKFGINRERVPFVLTEDFLYVISNGAENPKKSTEFQNFQKLCGRAYLILRDHASLLISLFTLMLPSGIAELQSISDVDYLRKTLAVDIDKQEALNYFQTRFCEAYGGGWITKLDWFFHSLNHIKDVN